MNMCYGCFQEWEGDGACPRCGYDPAADADRFPHALPHGTILAGKYITGRVLGQGGFGITYIAQEHSTEKLVAVKEYFPETMAGRDSSHSIVPYSGRSGEDFFYGKDAFLDEAKTLAQFNNSPNIIHVYSYFEENGTAYFAMEYAAGVTLQQYIKNKGGKITYDQAERLLLPVMEALSVVHIKGLIHRDIKPENIIICSDGNVKLIDFGAARYSLGDKSQSLDVVLTHGFSPFEQYSRNKDQGPYTDVYAFAATFYYAITGVVPPDSIDRLGADKLIPPGKMASGLSQAQENVILSGLAVQPEDRFQTMTSFCMALLKNQPPQALSFWEKAKKWVAAHRGPVAGSAAALVLALALLSIFRPAPDPDSIKPAANDDLPSVDGSFVGLSPNEGDISAPKGNQAVNDSKIPEGITSGNLLYQGRMAVYGNYRYSFVGDNKKSSLQVSVNGFEDGKLCDGSAYGYFNIYEDALYYIGSPDDNDVEKYIMRSDVDGEHVSVLWESTIERIGALYIRDGWLYVSSFVDDDCLYRLPLDKLNRGISIEPECIAEDLKNGFQANICFVGEYLYYFAKSDFQGELPIVRIKTDGTEKKVVFGGSNNGYQMISNGDGVYILEQNGYGGSILYLDQSGMASRIFDLPEDESVLGINSCNDWIYYMSIKLDMSDEYEIVDRIDENLHIVKISADGTESSEIGQVYCPGNGELPSMFAFEELQAVLCQVSYYNDGTVSWIDA